MQIILRTPNIHLEDQERAYLERKVLHLESLADRVSDESSRIHIDVRQTDVKTTDRKLHIQGTLHVPHEMIHAEARGMTFEEATDIFVEKLRKQIERYKEKLQGKKSTLENLKERISEY